MSKKTPIASAYPCIMVEYDETDSPMYLALVNSSLHQLYSTKTGKKLIDGLNVPKKAYQKEGWTVKIMRYSKKEFHEVMPTKGLPKGTAVIGIGMKCVKGSKIRASNGVGAPSVIAYNHNNIVTPDGTRPAYIGLGHELIHALHNLNGTAKPGEGDKAKEEEYFTVGLGKYKNESITENKLRAEHGIARRERYGGFDPDEKLKKKKKAPKKISPISKDDFLALGIKEQMVKILETIELDDDMDDWAKLPDRLQVCQRDVEQRNPNAVLETGSFATLRMSRAFQHYVQEAEKAKLLPNDCLSTMVLKKKKKKKERDRSDTILLVVKPKKKNVEKLTKKYEEQLIERDRSDTILLVKPKNKNAKKLTKQLEEERTERDSSDTHEHKRKQKNVKRKIKKRDRSDTVALLKVPKTMGE